MANGHLFNITKQEIDQLGLINNYRLIFQELLFFDSIRDNGFSKDIKQAIFRFFHFGYK